MQRYLLTIAYDGTDFAGWQRQPGVETIQAWLETVLARIFGQPVPVHGAGRTDAGVHALRQRAHVCLPPVVDAGKLIRSLNCLLPDSIAVRSIEPVPENFHARFSAIGKRYVYRCRVSRQPPVHDRRFVHWVKVPLDLERMRQAACLLEGEHDFAAFATNPGYPRTRGTVRRLSRLRLIRRSRGYDLMAQGEGFLYNMVRTIAGTLIDVGRGRREPTGMTEILESRDRNNAGMNAPACGLFLVRVLYPPTALDRSQEVR